MGVGHGKEPTLWNNDYILLNMYSMVGTISVESLWQHFKLDIVINPHITDEETASIYKHGKGWFKPKSALSEST